MKFAPVFLFSFIIGASVSSAYSKIPDSAAAGFINSVQELLFNDQFDSADVLCENFILVNSANPIGYLFKAGTLLGEMSDREEALYPQELKKLVDTVITLCDQGLKTGTGADAAYFYLWRGHAHVYRSLFESRFGSFTSALKHGFKAHDDYQIGLKLDPQQYDFYFGLGNYHYWKSVKAGILRSIGIISNEINKGIDELRLAADSGTYFQNAARNSELWIWLEQKEYEWVLIQGERILEKFPKSRTLRWPLASAYVKSERYREAADIYSYLRKYFDDNRGNYFNLIECDYNLYQCLKKLGRNKEADALLNSVSIYRSAIPKATRQRQSAKLNYLRRELAR